MKFFIGNLHSICRKMYWLNSLNKWIESAWMDGRNHVVNMFNQNLGDNVVTTGLSLDQVC